MGVTKHIFEEVLNSSTFRPAASQAAWGEFQPCRPYSPNILSVGGQIIQGQLVAFDVCKVPCAKWLPSTQRYVG